MKEATGEANITVITIVLIAIVLAVGTLIVNRVLNDTKKSSCCNSAGGYYRGSRCYKSKNAADARDYNDTWMANDLNSGYGKCLNNKAKA